MKAVWLDDVGGPEVLQYGDRPDPKPDSGDVRVRVKACSLNHLDIWVRRSKSFTRPIIPGSDVVGVVESIGDGVRSVEIGDEIIAYPCCAHKNTKYRLRGDVPLSPDFNIIGAHRNGALAEYAIIPADNLLPKPPNISWHQAACLPIAFMTAWHMLFTRGQLKSDETVLIQSAGSGVSHGAIQMAHMMGAHVIATTGSSKKMELAHALGADDVINYNTESVPDRVREITQGRGADVVMDHNGSATWDNSMASLAIGGRLVICGVTQGANVTLDVGTFFFASQSILGSTLGTAEDLLRVIHVVASGRVKPIIDRIFSLSEIQNAHEYMINTDRFGKIVIDIS